MKIFSNASYLRKLKYSLSEYYGFGLDSARLLKNYFFSPFGKKLNTKKNYSCVALVGVYGLEHVGDIGILGGVLLRIHQKYNVKDVKLFSLRPRYTQYLADELDTPVNLRVYSAEASAFRNELSDCEAVFWAGGPLMDLPRVLCRNLSVIFTMRRHGKPFYIEGIGVGPFKRQISRWAARTVAKKASHITVRTKGAAANKVLSGIDVSVSRCPAFDYLSSRQERLTKLSNTDKMSADHLLENTSGHTLVGINIRLVRHF